MSNMSKFLQLHLLTSYPPSNPNRDDLGRPKTANFGNAERMRISSQSLKRALRSSDAFRENPELLGKMGDRTTRFGELVEAHLQGKVPEDKALEIAKQVAKIFGKLDDANKHHGARIKQLALLSPDEQEAAFSLADKLVSGEELPSDKEVAKLVFKTADGAVDMAMFGRMLADNADYNREAAVQIAHAITTNKITVENDFYTALDDLKKPSEDAGADFIGDLGFSSGVFYIYACIDKDLLVENLAGDKALAAIAIKALIEALATSSPSGKKNSFAHGGRAEFILAETGSQQPRTLASAFLKPVRDESLMEKSIKELETYRANMDQAYGACADEVSRMQAGKEGSLEELKTFAVKEMG